jgi:hypothetical protein
MKTDLPEPGYYWALCRYCPCHSSWEAIVEVTENDKGRRVWDFHQEIQPEYVSQWGPKIEKPELKWQ